MAEAKAGGTKQVAGDAFGAGHGVGERLDDLIEGLIRAKVFLALIAGQIEGNDRDGQFQRLGQPAGIILDQFGGAGGPHDHRLRGEAGKGIAGGVLEQVGGIGAKVTRLKAGIGDGRAVVAPFDHGEQKVGVSIALRGVQHVMQAGHAGGDTHGPHMGWAFICPDAELHGNRRGFCTPGPPQDIC